MLYIAWSHSNRKLQGKMLSSTLKQFRHCSRSFSRLCAIQARARQAPGAAVSSKVTQGSEGRRFSTDETQYLQIDCQEVCFKSLIADHENGIMSKVEERRPEVVLLDHLHESDFWGKIQSLMRHLGYTGSIEDSRHGRVKGVFIRNDLMGRRSQSEGGTFYKSRMPDPY
ncbi:uncharacterized protein LOC128184442 [Crassostrea angulata]|nr:uncharacterized protein LOC128184442 [Crassostrea angulata]